MGFNKRKPPDRTIYVAVDLSAAFDTVCHNNLLSKINRSQLPPATARWLSCYLRGRQAKTCFRGVKSTSRKVNTGVSQGSKLSPSLSSFYIADMPRPTEPVKRVCYAADITVWATGVYPDLDDSVNSYLEEIIAYQKDNSLLISAPKWLETTQPTNGGAVTAYKRWSCHSGLKLQCKLCRTFPPPAMGGPIYRFWGMPAMRTRWMAGAAVHKTGDVETNPGPTTLNK